MIHGGWRYIAASVIGTSHEKSGGACQDANGCFIHVCPDGETILVAAVADGAGSALAGGEGAAKSCAALLDLIAQHLASSYNADGIALNTAKSWITSIQATLDAEALATSRERKDFACTLLAMIVGHSSAACLQIGDGVMVLADSEEQTYGHVFWPDRGEYANTTHFITQEEALEHLQFTTIRRCIVEVALLTDGLQTVALNYQQQSAHEPFFKGLFAPLRSVPEGHSVELSNSLAAFLSSSRVNDKTDDDKTLVLASRVAANASPSG